MTRMFPRVTDQLGIATRSFGSTIEVSLRGELDMSTAPHFAEHLHSLLSSDSNGVVTLHVDLLNLTFIDVLGYHALSSVCGHRPSGGPFEVTVSNACGQVLHFFDLVLRCQSLPFRLVG